MNRKKITVMWMPSVTSKSRVFSVPPLLLYVFVCMIMVSWALLGIGGYVGHKLYHEYLALRAENAALLKKKAELEALEKAMERIRRDEATIRNFLGLEKREDDGGGGLGQGGEPSPDLSTIDPNDSMTTGSLPPPASEVHKSSLVQEARRLQASLQELVENLRDQRQVWDSTPSILPVAGDNYWFSSGFGWRRSPFTGLREFHNAVDISGKRHTPVIAPANGVVAYAGRDKYLGKYLRIDHGRGIVTIYGHLAEFKVRKGQKVKRGDIIALMGNTGLSTGHHLHYGVKVNGRWVNPLHYVLNAGPTSMSLAGGTGQ